MRLMIMSLASLLLCTAPVSAELEQARVRAFIAADTDRDRLLSLPEFRDFIRQMAAAGAPISIRIQTLSAYARAFQHVDTNADGFASPDELRAVVAEN